MKKKKKNRIARGGGGGEEEDEEEDREMRKMAIGAFFGSLGWKCYSNMHLCLITYIPLIQLPNKGI